MNLIVNTRYNERRHTIFTSNYEDTPEEASDSQDFTLKERIGFRIHSRLHEMCEFLEFDGADYRHAPPNAGPDDLLAMWKRKGQGGRRTLPTRAKGPIRAQIKTGKAELGWSGGKAGS
jgi:DNA replication protein DnaC